ncbi:MAG: CoA transferase [Methyloligellaceae bacterium]
MPPGEMPLAGFRILDLTTTVFGPYTTQLLGDFGADVIKIEAPGGDALRGIEPARHDGMGALFLGTNRNKRSLLLDLRREEARAALWKLIAGADALVHNMRPAKIAALGFSPEGVMQANARIVYAALVGYLSDGPYAGRPAYDDAMQGECGMAATFAMRDGEPALAPSVSVDKTAALMAASAILAALLKRQRTGKGVHLESGMFETMVAFNLVEHQAGTIFSPPLGDAGYRRTLSPNRRPFATRDGHICMLAYTDEQWRRFWELAGQPERAAEERFATMAARSRNIDALYAEAAAVLGSRTTAQWLEALRGAEIPCGPVNGFEDLRRDPHLEAIGFYRRVAHPSEGELELPDSGYRFDGQPLPVTRHQPRLGEHSREVLEEAGCSEAEIRALLD